MLWHIYPNLIVVARSPHTQFFKGLSLRKAFKGQSNEIFCLWFFTNGSLPSPLLGIWRLFEFGFEFEEIVAIYDWLSAIVYWEELKPPVLLNTESRDSSHCSQRRVTNVWVFCRNSGLPCDTGSRYSPYCLIQRVTTPCIVYSQESLMAVGSLFLTILKDIEAKNWLRM